MHFNRSAGILLHPTSFPGKFGIGDLGKEAYKFIDFLVEAEQYLWQTFPLGPTGYGDSPYQCFSAFAGNPLLISPELLYEDGLLNKEDLDNYPDLSGSHVDFGKVIQLKTELLKKSFNNFLYTKDKFLADYNKFLEKNNYWLKDFSLFMASKEYHNGVSWQNWTPEIAFRYEGAVEKWTDLLKDRIEYFNFTQFIFDKQWTDVKDYATKNKIKIIGDLPIFIAYDSADLWANRNLFTVDEHGNLITCAGVPPDYFSPTGQLWGNPLYKWDEMEKDDFLWWQKRFSKLFEMVDYVRIDHFRGFDAFYEIPGDAKTAEHGKWVKAPGEKLFNTIRQKLGDVPIIAEDLGVITETVEELRNKFNFPGMKILQFAFGKDGEKKFLPHNFIPNCIVYTGSHDNDTTRGFFEKAKIEDPNLYKWTCDYLGYYGDNICFEIIREAYKSVANLVIIPLQDVLNLGSEARMNFPGKLGGNWTWRFTEGQISEDTAKSLKDLVNLYERNPFTKKKAEYQKIDY